MGVIPMPVALYTFTSQYCGRKISTRQIIYLFILPIFSFVLMATTYWHSLFFQTMKFVPNSTLFVEHGYYFSFVHLPYSYILVVISIFIVLFEFIRTSQRFRVQISFLFISMLLTLTLNVASLAGFFSGFSITPLAFLIFMIVSGIGIFHYQFLGGNPIAYETVFQTSREGVIILDLNNDIMDINPSAANGLGMTQKELIGKNLKEVLTSWGDAFLKHKEDFESNSEFEIKFR